jgi:excisionase family DNA binding protein
MDLVSINEIAGLLNVSVQTVRNWEEKGYLKSTRTVGGHRRFNLQSVRDFHDNIKNNLSLIMCGEALDEQWRRDERIYQALTATQAKKCGGFTEVAMAILTQNQLTCYGKDNREYAKELMFKIAGYLSSPYFFPTQAMFNSSELIFYQRKRTNNNSCNFVIESEEVYSTTWKRRNTYLHDGDEELEGFQEMCDDIDRGNLNSIISNVQNPTSVSREALEETIVEEVTKKAWTGINNIVVIMPPELCDNNYKFEKLNDNTRKISNVGIDIPNLEMYSTRLIPSDKVIIGNKDWDNCGYVFTPYVLAFKHHDLFIRAGRKLLREGINFYNVIHCE